MKNNNIEKLMIDYKVEIQWQGCKIKIISELFTYQDSNGNTRAVADMNFIVDLSSRRFDIDELREVA